MSLRKDELAAIIDEMTLAQLQSALHFLTGNDVKATEDAITYALKTSPAKGLESRREAYDVRARELGF